MATAKKAAIDFQEIIQADRQRRKNEDLAQQIFGKARRASAPGAGIGPRKPGTGPSLASRIGVTKQRSSSGTRAPTVGKAKRNPPPVGNVNAEWTHDLFNGDSGATQGYQRNSGLKTSRVPKETRLYSAINGVASSANNQFNIVGSSRPATGFSIRGLAGPCVVIAENFAPGTSAEDIEQAMTPYGGPILKCKLLPSNSTVIAEIVFDTRDGADRVIEQFHNQSADGLVLRLYHKSGAAAVSAVTPTGPRADLIKSKITDSRSNRYGASDRYEPRSSSRDRKNDREDVVDGSYGFEDKMDTDDGDGRLHEKGRGRGGLYSDNMVTDRGDRGDGGDRRWGRGDGRNRGRGGGGRDRGRGFR